MRCPRNFAMTDFGISATLSHVFYNFEPDIPRPFEILKADSALCLPPKPQLDDPLPQHSLHIPSVIHILRQIQRLERPPMTQGLVASCEYVDGVVEGCGDDPVEFLSREGLLHLQKAWVLG